MKKLINVLLMGATVVCLAACGNKDTESVESSTATESSVYEETTEPEETTAPTEEPDETMPPDETIEPTVSVESSDPDEQPKTPVTMGVSAADEEGLISAAKADLSISHYDTSYFSENTRSQIIFNVFPEEDAYLCLALAEQFFDSIEEFELTDWISSVHYVDAWSYVVKINCEHYKFVISEDRIFLTDEI